MDSVAPMRLLLAVVVSAAFLGGADAKVEIKPMRHDIQQIVAKGFDGVIGKFRDSQVAALWFFKDDNKEDEKFLDEYNKVASELKGMVKITAISCTEWGSWCEKQGMKESGLMLYPVNPQPAFKFEGKMEQKAIAGKISKLIPDHSTKLNAENVDKFLSEVVTKPKVLLFSKSKSAASIFKALSSETVFQRTMKFGFVTEEEAAVVAKFKVTKFPSFIMVRGQKAELRETYKGEMNFLDLKDWVNLHSESGMGDKVQSGGAAGAEESLEESKPWLVQEVPELTAKSHNDICFKGEGLCVIYLKDGETTPAETEMLTGLSKKFTSQLSDRGAKMKWMWMNVAIEGKYKALFEPTQLPSAVVFNPHKRLRFTNLDHGEEGEIKGDTASLTALMDKVLGGDARFKMVPGQKLPEWTLREVPKKDEKKKEL